jgi:hypothetical protein
LIYRKADGAIDGYIIYRLSVHNARDMRLVRVCDLVGTDVARAALLADAIGFAQQSDAYGIVALSSSADSGLYRNAGLWAAKPFPIILAPQIKEKPQVAFFDSDLDDLW